MRPEEKPAAAIYLRVSTGEQDERNQLEACKQLARARGYLVPFVYSERESGVEERPRWAACLEGARRGEHTAVVIWSLDRIGRRMFELIADVRALGDLGCRVISVQESWLDTGPPMMRDLLLAVFSWVAQYEHERIGQRTLAGLERARKKGAKLGRRQVWTPAQLDRAAELRARVPPVSWRAIGAELGIEGATLHRALQRRRGV